MANLKYFEVEFTVDGDAYFYICVADGADAARAMVAEHMDGVFDDFDPSTYQVSERKGLKPGEPGIVFHES